MREAFPHPAHPLRGESGRTGPRRLPPGAPEAGAPGPALFVCAPGIGLITNAELGTSPVTSLPYVAGRILGLTPGTLTFALNVLFLPGQKIVPGPEFRRSHLLQLPAVFLFGAFIDPGMALTGLLPVHACWHRPLLCVAGSAVLGLGISLEIAGNAAVLPGNVVFRQLTPILSAQNLSGFGVVPLEQSNFKILQILRLSFRRKRGFLRN